MFNFTEVAAAETVEFCAEKGNTFAHSLTHTHTLRQRLFLIKLIIQQRVEITHTHTLFHCVKQENFPSLIIPNVLLNRAMVGETGR